MQHSDLPHHYTSQSEAPGAGGGWVAQGGPVALWSATASLLPSNPQAANALQRDRSLELVKISVGNASDYSVSLPQSPGCC